MCKDISNEGHKLSEVKISLFLFLLIGLHFGCGANLHSEAGGYGVFGSKHLFLKIFNCSEFDRYTRFNSWGSARETFDWSEMCRVQIPLPPIDVQQAIVDVYRCLERAKYIASQAREKLKTLCPALVQRAAHS